MRVIIEFLALRHAGAVGEVLGQVDEDLHVAPDASHAVRVAHVAILCNNQNSKWPTEIKFKVFYALKLDNASQRNLM